jgi:hypothetical protein
VLTAAVDAFHHLANQASRISNGTPAPPPPPAPLLTPAPSPVFAWRPSRAPNPFRIPDSPPSPPTSHSPHRDITYAHTRSAHRLTDARLAASVPENIINRTHHCLPLDGVLPHPPTIYASPPFHAVPEWGQTASAHQSSSASVPPPLSRWRQAQEDEHARPAVPTPWQPFRWGRHETDGSGPDTEPEPWGHTPRHSSDFSTPTQSYAHTRSAHRPPAPTATTTRSSFRGGTTVIATASAWDPSNPDPASLVPILVGLDSYSDITVAAPELV